jgi:hypothetical protein
MMSDNEYAEIDTATTIPVRMRAEGMGLIKPVDVSEVKMGETPPLIEPILTKKRNTEVSIILRPMMRFTRFEWVNTVCNPITNNAIAPM